MRKIINPSSTPSFTGSRGSGSGVGTTNGTTQSGNFAAGAQNDVTLWVKCSSVCSANAPSSGDVCATSGHIEYRKDGGSWTDIPGTVGTESARHPVSTEIIVSNPKLDGWVSIDLGPVTDISTIDLRGVGEVDTLTAGGSGTGTATGTDWYLIVYSPGGIIGG